MEDFATLLPRLGPAGGAAGAPLSYAACFDGHNGAGAARYAASHLHRLLMAHPGLCGGEGAGAGGAEAALRDVFESIDEQIIAASDADGRRDGTTALVALRVGPNLLVAHAGDSRAVAGLAAEGGCCARRLTEDHTALCAAEAARVTAAGGELLFAGCWRVISATPSPLPPGAPPQPPGGPTVRSALAVTRALGDAAFKRPERHVIATPDVARLALTPQLRFVLLASDGVWDVLSDQAAVDVASAALSKAGGEGGETRAQRAAEAVTHAALLRGTADNVTCVVLLPLWTGGV